MAPPVILIGGNVLLLSTSGFKKTFSAAACLHARRHDRIDRGEITAAHIDNHQQVNETSAPRHSRERANAVRPFADGHARSSRSNRGDRVSTEVRSSWTARLSSFSIDPTAVISIFAPFLPGNPGTRDPGLDLCSPSPSARTASVEET